MLLLLAGCGQGEPQRLRLATTTSTQDSGLLDALLPEFERAYAVEVEVIAVGTGQALALGERGDVDVLLVHAREREEAFVAAGHGTARSEVMYNDFVLVGPPSDPAGIAGASSAVEALQLIGQRGSAFASRGDDSGTHTAEQKLWKAAAVDAEGQSWYRSLGQGMGETLIFAHEQGAYTLTDRGTYLAQRGRLPGLALLAGGASIADNPDLALRNVYGVIPVSAATHPAVNQELAQTFATWITSPEAQQQIGRFGVESFGQPLFYPSAETLAP